MRLGVLGYADHSGLGRMTGTLIRQFGATKHLAPSNEGKTPVWEQDLAPWTHRCDTWTPTPLEVRDFLADLDVVVTVETDYRCGLADAAKNAGVFSILLPMWEWQGNPFRYPGFDRYLCTSKFGYHRCPMPNKVYAPWPVEGHWPIELHARMCRIFLHNAGHGGMHDRKGTIDAVRGFLAFRHPQCTLRLRSQVPLAQINPDLPGLCASDPRIDVRIGSVPDDELYAGADAYLYPARLDGQAMVPHEAMAANLLTFVTDAPPINEYHLHPMQYLPCRRLETRDLAGQRVVYHQCTPSGIARALTWAAEGPMDGRADLRQWGFEEFHWKKLLAP